MVGLNKNRRQDALKGAWARPFADLRGLVRRFAGDRGANVLIMFALTLPILLAIVGGGIDFSYAEDSKTQLQDASDAASLAVSAEVVKHPNDSVATLKTLAQNTLTADYVLTGSTAPTVTDFHVCAPVQKDCTDGSATLANNTVFVAAQATAPCIPLPLPTIVCQGSPPGQAVSSSSTTVIGFGSTLQLNIVMDSSASMIVGATPADVTNISNWVTAHWNSVKPGDPSPYTNNDNPPCAFACHDEGDSTTAADIAQGLTNATAAGATTRFTVMIGAANQLITHVVSLLNANSHLAQNNYVFNVYSFDTAIHKYGSSNMTCTAAAGGCNGPTNAVSAVVPGLDTDLNTLMAKFAASSGTNAIGANGTGASAASPLKFMILVTDGLQSSRDNNWGGSTVSSDPAWGPYPSLNPQNGAYPTASDNARASSSSLPLLIHSGAFDGPIDTTNCTKLKNEGVVLAVLETPYVPLDGQDGHVQPYEQTVRHTIYPGGPGSPSTLSTALSACASTGYYFQAVNSTDIATGFLALTDKFVQSHSFISK